MKKLVVSLLATLFLGLSFGALNASVIDNGVIVASNDKCGGSGACGGEKSSKKMKCGEGKCGGEKKGTKCICDKDKCPKDGKCTNKDCKCEKKGKKGKCGEGKCGGEKKGKSSGACGQGKCGN